MTIKRLVPFAVGVATVMAVSSGVAWAAPASNAPVAPIDSGRAQVSPRVARSAKVGSAPAAQRRTVTVALASRDPQGLADFDAAVSDPGSPQFRRFLTPAEFASRFGPSPSEVTTATDYLRSHGLQVGALAQGQQTISATGTVDQLGATFGTGLSQYRDPKNGAEFIGADSSAKASPAAASVITDVSGLTDAPLPVTPPPTAQVPQKPKLAPNAVTDKGSGPKGGFTAAELSSAYAAPTIGGNGGSGQTIALVEFSGYKPANYKAFDSQYGITAPAVQTIDVDGGPAGDLSGQGEVDLDIEVLHSIAPKATILNYQAPNVGNADVDLYSKIVSDNRASIVSISWGESELAEGASGIRALSNIIAQGVAQGQTFVDAAGDHGSSDQWNSSSRDTTITVDYPASDPNVTGVGGSRLFINSTTGAWANEKVWNDYAAGIDPSFRGASGGGVSTYFAKPSWQTGTGVDGGAKRQVPDIAGVAAEYQFSTYTELSDAAGNDTGGGWTASAGTSGAAPLNAALLALTSAKAGGKRFGNINPTLYRVATSTPGAFHDITTGTNSITGNTGVYPTTASYDKTTGLGTPNNPAYATAVSAP
ncbi:S53 family peptidase [Williamsia maris]|uniref:Kumamolisin n=1 Tax=Williamsia maris TaxID=72806 RepID=A0ABT1HC90_9NOCA|nr:S53 family peptidase [Williamsia maris]MCP2175874.1 kumamolisin [Williamsia maris]